MLHVLTFERVNWIILLLLSCFYFSILTVILSSWYYLLVDFSFCFCLQVGNGACYILFKNFRKPVFYHEKGLSLEVLIKGKDTLHASQC